MVMIENGGAIAIKGFNYQKSVLVLIAVLHYLSEEDFEIYVESKDDLVVKLNGTETYIQVKGKNLSVSILTQRPKNKDSIIEKNLANGDEANSYYKIIAPSFSNSVKYLNVTKPRIFRRGAKIFEYTEDGIDELLKKIPSLPKIKLKNSRLVLTEFSADIDEALNYIIGIMVKEEIPVDNNFGMSSLQELCMQIDQRSEKVVKDDADYELKKFTTENLSNIFSHTYKAQYFDDLLSKLDYTIAKQSVLKSKRVKVAAIYKSFCTEAKKQIESLDIMNMKEDEVLEKVLEAVDFKAVDEDLDRIAIVLEAFSLMLFERSRV